MGPRLEELQEEGDYIVHRLAKQSFIFTRDENGAIRCFLNVCQHRGNRLVTGGDSGKAKFFECAFHGRPWNIDGSIKGVPDPDTYPQCAQGGVGAERSSRGPMARLGLV